MFSGVDTWRRTEPMAKSSCEIELTDRTMLGLARDIAMFRPTTEAAARGDPEAVLFVEFAEDDQ